MKPLILPFDGQRPELGQDVFLAPGAAAGGDVHLARGVSVWYAAVVRGDVNRITIGEDSNVQDGAVLHGTLGEWPVVIGARVSIGHHATVHGCVIEDGQKAGMNERGRYVAPGQRVTKDGDVVGDPPESTTLSLWVSGLASPFVTSGMRLSANDTRAGPRWSRQFTVTSGRGSGPARSPRCRSARSPRRRPPRRRR